MGKYSPNSSSKRSTRPPWISLTARSTHGRDGGSTGGNGAFKVAERATCGVTPAQGVTGSIQVTPETYEHLRERYLFEPRGCIPVKGKGELMTYWLTGRRERNA
ncbi:MAG: adenylate/guanylate cyclase domain-containing protein [Chloroflexaceae bacterium]|nr:adenylate/guanylate cyclase domain-containing protein [Chloroflexaceae bacterium]